MTPDCIRRPHSYWTTCPCDDCRQDRARTKKRHWVGLSHRIPHDTAWAILAARIDQGWTAKALGSATGLDHEYFGRHVAQHRKGATVYLGPTVAAAIVTMGRPTEGQIGAEPARRRLRALAAIGYGLNAVAAESGTQFSTLAMLRRPEAQRCSARIANAITDTYARIHMTPGSDKQATRIAREKGWPPPLAWADIDDPDETPTGYEYEPLPRNSASEHRREVITEMAERGAGISEVCGYFKISAAALEKWCDRAGIRPTFNTLNGREHIDGNHRNSRPGTRNPYHGDAA